MPKTSPWLAEGGGEARLYGRIPNDLHAACQKAELPRLNASAPLAPSRQAFRVSESEGRS